MVAGTVGDDLFITLAGELDLGAITHLDRALASFAVEAPFRRVLVDASAVVFCDSTGIQWLLHLPHRVRAIDGLRMLNVSPAVERVFTVAGLRGLLTRAAPELALG
ncbi:MAG: STAS domain-containing protein [Acidimicrobiia bacterium]|nr:STAS domain-containing protein [Acidimicrobiia bacterium]